MTLVSKELPPSWDSDKPGAEIVFIQSTTLLAPYLYNDPVSVFECSCSSPTFIEQLLSVMACGQEYQAISRQQGYS